MFRPTSSFEFIALVTLAMPNDDHYIHVRPTTPVDGPHPDGETTHRQLRKASTLKRIGWYGFVVILGGIPLQLGIMAFLGYLWSHQSASDGSDSLTGQRVWRIIVLNAWMVQTITLCALVVRAFVGVQLVVCTAFIASLILESGSAFFEDAAKLSILRVYNGGPLDVVWMALNRLPRFRLSLLESIAAFLFMLGTALQFSSTLLVSDLAGTVINSDPELRRVALIDTSGVFIDVNGKNMWTKQPGVWPTFAEARDGNATLAAGVSDTGTVFRALLPFESKDRILLRSYDGLAVMQEARTVCVPADLGDASLSLFQELNQMSLTGTVSAPLRAFHDAGFVFKDRTSGFPDDSKELSNVPFQCPYWEYHGLAEGEDRDLGIRYLDFVLAMCSIGDRGFERFVLVNFRPGDIQSLSTTWLEPSARFERKADENGWGKYTMLLQNGTKKEGVFITASVCGLRQKHTIQAISASTTISPVEYPLRWHNTTPGSTDPNYPVLRLLGVVDEASGPEARGLLRLHSHSPSDEFVRQYSNDLTLPDRTTAAMDKAFSKGFAVPKRDYLTLESYNESLVFCTHCLPVLDASINNTVHPAHIILLQAALKATNNPATALDALWTTWSQQIYSDVVGQLDGVGSQDTTIVWATTVLAPQRWRGYIVTLALLIAYGLLTLLVVLLFTIRTAYSFRGGSWQAIAQLVLGDVKELLEEVTALPDDKVAGLIKARGLDGVKMGMSADSTMDAVKIVRRETTWRADGC